MQLQIHAQKRDKKNLYIITLKGDTIYYESVEPAFLGGFNCKTSNGKSEHYKEKDLAGLKAEFQAAIIGKPRVYIYERKFLKPHKNSDKTVLLELIMHNDKCKLYRYFLSTGQTSKEEFHLYENDKFIDYVERNNFEMLLTKYFGDCDYFTQNLKETRFGKLYELTIKVNVKCE